MAIATLPLRAERSAPLSTSTVGSSADTACAETAQLFGTVGVEGQQLNGLRLRTSHGRLMSPGQKD